MWNQNYNPSYYGNGSGMEYGYQQAQPQQYAQMQTPTRTNEEPLNWELVKNLDPNLLKRTGDLTILQPFISDFIVADFEGCPSRLLTHPLLVRLMMILQHALLYMSDVQKQYQKKIELREKEYKAQQEKLKKVYLSYKKADEYIKKHSQNFEKCPICRKKYKSMKYLDAHFAKHHPIYNDAWLEIRSLKPQESARYIEHNRLKQKEKEQEQIIINNQKEYSQLVELYNEMKEELKQERLSRMNEGKSPRRKSRKEQKLKEKLNETASLIEEADTQQDELELSLHKDLEDSLSMAVDDLSASWNAWQLQIQKSPPSQKTTNQKIRPTPLIVPAARGGKNNNNNNSITDEFPTNESITIRSPIKDKSQDESSLLSPNRSIQELVSTNHALPNNDSITVRNQSNKPLSPRRKAQTKEPKLSDTQEIRELENQISLDNTQVLMTNIKQLTKDKKYDKPKRATESEAQKPTPKKEQEKAQLQIQTHETNFEKLNESQTKDENASETSESKALSSLSPRSDVSDRTNWPKRERTRQRKTPEKKEPKPERPIEEAPEIPSKQPTKADPVLVIPSKQKKQTKPKQTNQDIPRPDFPPKQEKKENISINEDEMKDSQNFTKSQTFPYAFDRTLSDSDDDNHLSSLSIARDNTVNEKDKKEEHVISITNDKSDHEDSLMATGPFSTTPKRIKPKSPQIPSFFDDSSEELANTTPKKRKLSTEEGTVNEKPHTKETPQAEPSLPKEENKDTINDKLHIKESPKSKTSNKEGVDEKSHIKESPKSKTSNKEEVDEKSHIKESPKSKTSSKEEIKEKPHVREAPKLNLSVEEEDSHEKTNFEDAETTNEVTHHKINDVSPKTTIDNSPQKENIQESSEEEEYEGLFEKKKTAEEEEYSNSEEFSSEKRKREQKNLEKKQHKKELIQKAQQLLRKKAKKPENGEILYSKKDNDAISDEDAFNRITASLMQSVAHTLDNIMKQNEQDNVEEILENQFDGDRAEYERTKSRFRAELDEKHPIPEPQSMIDAPFDVSQLNQTEPINHSYLEETAKNSSPIQNRKEEPKVEQKTETADEQEQKLTDSKDPFEMTEPSSKAPFSFNLDSTQSSFNDPNEIKITRTKEPEQPKQTLPTIIETPKTEQPKPKETEKPKEKQKTVVEDDDYDEEEEIEYYYYSDEPDEIKVETKKTPKKDSENFKPQKSTKVDTIPVEKPKPESPKNNTSTELPKKSPKLESPKNSTKAESPKKSPKGAQKEESEKEPYFKEQSSLHNTGDIEYYYEEEEIYVDEEEDEETAPAKKQKGNKSSQDSFVDKGSKKNVPRLNPTFVEDKSMEDGELKLDFTDPLKSTDHYQSNQNKKKNHITDDSFLSSDIL